ncbi:alpha/beta hydrolase [Rhizobium sp. SSA_523]|uniref:alpha/beta hydrolase n=1 Tax=Rhizobium sp. SSA_523 TaxID=2952477 RepID=UPI0020914D7F|nr:alpha/beta fold hydrolase [Rhizobium sp. SSA_523]MCO5733443.1 alpha/beta fold hydrolase [Rhizobium sp. SSA_523]
MASSTVVLAAAVALSQEILAPGPAGDLSGTFTRVRDPSAPVVLIIPGSGPTDRDGNSRLGIQAGSYRLLAEGLAARGISSVRIDKRGMFGSAGAAADANAVTVDDYVADVRSWTRSIAAETGRDCVWLLGHSEGGLVALAAAQVEPSICGLILIATPGRPMGEVLKEQLAANPANAAFLGQANTAIDMLASGKRVGAGSLPEPLRPLFAPALQDFLASVFRLDPAKLIGSLAKPILILQGDRDLQVGVGDAERLKAAAGKAMLVLLPGVNHVLKAVPPNDPTQNLTSYADPDLPLAAGIVDAIRTLISAKPERDDL